jgi:hypothetical protein
MNNYDKEGFFVALQAHGQFPARGEVRHFHFAEHAVNFLASLQAGDREHGVALVSRRSADEAALMSLEVLATEGWPTQIYSTTEKRIF